MQFSYLYSTAKEIASRATRESRQTVRFPANNGKTTSLRTTVTLSYVPSNAPFLYPSWKFQPEVIIGQANRLGQMTLPPKISVIAPWLQFLNDRFETFRS